MAKRHVLSLEEQRAGVAAALRSAKTPKALRPALRRRLRDLDHRLRLSGRARKPARKPRFLGWFEW